MRLLKNICLRLNWNRHCLFLRNLKSVVRETKQFNHHYQGNGKYPKTVRIGCGSGFWGDSSVAAQQLIHHGRIDFLVFDYLSEITMSLLTAAKQKNPNMGYAPDFVHFSLVPYLEIIKDKGIKVVSNAGGVNPHACAKLLREFCMKKNVDLKIAVVTGDDLMLKIEKMKQLSPKDMSSGMEFPKTVHSMNVYLGAGPIEKALDLGADIVVTGRCVDSALVLGPLLHTFKYKKNDFDLLASGSLAGHIVECGAQATGGNFSDWHTVKNWDTIGFPIVEFSEDGSFLVTKPQSTGGCVTRATVCEQMLYEIGDPKRYQLPDVTADFSQVQIKEIEGMKDMVLVQGAKGTQPSNDYKVTATYADGFRATAVACVGGPRSEEKATKTADAILERCRKIFKKLNLADFTKVHVELLGSEPYTSCPQTIPRQLGLWLAVQHDNKTALEIFAREIAPAGTGMAPGLTGIVGGRPRVSPVLKLFSFLYPKDNITVKVFINGELKEKFKSLKSSEFSETVNQKTISNDKKTETLPDGNFTFRLEELAYTRSGDKGNTANIGVIARDPSYLPYLKKALTEEAIKEYFSYLFEDSRKAQVTRYDVPGIHGINFVLHNSLGGGGIASLRSDPQGKALGQILMDFPITCVPNLCNK